MAEPLRILQFVNTLEFGGATDYALTLSEHLDKNRFQSYFAHGPGSGWEARADDCSTDVLNLDTMKPSHTQETDNTILGDIVALWRLYRYLRVRKIDIIHTHGSKSRLLGGMAATIARTPLRVQSAHGFAFNSRQSQLKNFAFVMIERIMGALHHELVLESKYDLEEAKKASLGRSRRYIYTGIPFKPLDDLNNGRKLREKLGISTDDIVVTMVGRLTEQKDPHTFVKAAQIVLKKHPNTIFLIVGDGDLQESTASLIADSKSIRLLGRRTDANTIITASDVYMLCSRWEGIPLTILAAQYLGKPIIATDKLGLPEVVVDGETGLLAREGNPQDYAYAVSKLVTDRNLRNSLGSQGKKMVSTRHSVRTMISEFEKLYTTTR